MTSATRPTTPWPPMQAVTPAQRRRDGPHADLGLLRWQTRLIRAGWRAEQTSNQCVRREDRSRRSGVALAHE